MKKALLIQTAFIGDAILSTALLSSIKELGYACDVLVRSGNEVFFNDHTDCRKVHIWHKKGFITKYKSLIALNKIIRSEDYDLVVNLQRFAATGLLTAFSGAKSKVGFTQNPLSFAYTHKLKHTVKLNYHECNRNVELLQLVHPETKFKAPNLTLVPSVTESIAQYQSNSYVCIFPGSVWFSKRLSSEKWVELVDKIPKDKTIYFLGAPNEYDLCQNIIDKVSPSRDAINLCGKLGILQSAALGKSADMNYCNDSSPVHFLTAVNAKISAFFLSTSALYGFYPLSDVSYIQEVNGLKCKPCGMVGKAKCPENHFNCNHQLVPKTYL